MGGEPESWDDYFVCPHCGAEVETGARSCPECGSDEQTGWAEDADVAGLDLPSGYGGEDGFDYDDYVRREFGPADRPSATRVVLTALALVLVLALLVWLLNAMAR